MQTVFDIATKISTPLALGGLFAAILFLIFRQILAKNIFPGLTRAVGGQIVILIINKLFWLAFTAMILGFAGFLVVELKGRTRNEDPSLDKGMEYAGQVINSGGSPVYGAVVQISDERGNIQEKRTDSLGLYQYVLPPSVKSVCISVRAESYEQKERCLSVDQTGREPFIVQPIQITPTPVTRATTSTGTSKRRSTGGTAPCNAEDRLLGKC